MKMDVKEVLNQCGQMVSAATKLAEDHLKVSLQKFMEDHPAIEQIGWYQYTPYFNDGDTCVFGVGEFLFKPVCTKEEAEALGDDDYGFGEGWICMYSVKDYLSVADEKDLKDLFKDLSANEDMLKVVFGDHVKVFISKDGAEIEEYDHE